MLLFKEADRCGGVVSPGMNLMPGIDSLGSSFASSMLFATSFTATQHDGVAAVRPLRFDYPCGCWAHAGPQQVLAP